MAENLFHPELSTNRILSSLRDEIWVLDLEKQYQKIKMSGSSMISKANTILNNSSNSKNKK